MPRNALHCRQLAGRIQVVTSRRRERLCTPAVSRTISPTKVGARPLAWSRLDWAHLRLAGSALPYRLRHSPCASRRTVVRTFPAYLLARCRSRTSICLCLTSTPFAPLLRYRLQIGALGAMARRLPRLRKSMRCIRTRCRSGAGIWRSALRACSAPWWRQMHHRWASRSCTPRSGS